MISNTGRGFLFRAIFKKYNTSSSPTKFTVDLTMSRVQRIHYKMLSQRQYTLFTWQESVGVTAANAKCLLYIYLMVVGLH